MLKKISLLIFILVPVIILSWIQLKDPKMSSNNTKVVELAMAKELYASNCSSCHMNNLSGNSEWKSSLDKEGQRLPPPLDGTGHTWHHAPQQLFDIIRYGYKKTNPNYQGKMLGNENLTDDEIWSILEYIKNIWPETIQIKYESNFNE